MSHISDQAVGLILDNYADVIDGGTTWRGSGTSYRGIPGTHSNDPGLRSGDDTPLDAESGTTTTFVVDSEYSWTTSRWVKTDTPGYFAVCSSATVANTGAARRVTGWNDTTKTFTTDAFPSALVADDVLTMRQGFKRIPNGIDILGAAGNGYDRFYDLRVDGPGQMQEFFGSGVVTYVTTLEIRLRILKAAREHDAQKSAMENLAIIRPILCRGANPDHRDASYTQALIPTTNKPELVLEDAVKLVYADRYELRYRIETTFK